jgi:hypothetical protein
MLASTEFSVSNVFLSMYFVADLRLILSRNFACIDGF